MKAQNQKVGCRRQRTFGTMKTRMRTYTEVQPRYMKQLSESQSSRATQRVRRHEYAILMDAEIKRFSPGTPLRCSLDGNRDVTLL